MNLIIRENSYSNQQPRMGNWGVGSSNNCSIPGSCNSNRGITTAPIAGWRKTLNCPLDCSCNQIISFTQTPGAFLFGPGDIVTQAPSATGTVKSIDNTGAFPVITINVDDCENHPFFTPGNPVLINGVALTTPFIVSEPSTFENLGNNRADPLTTEIYKDTWTDCTNACPSGTSGNQTRTSRPIIRSGLQYKKDASGNVPYAFSFRQYRHNKKNITYQRKLSKFERSGDDTFVAGNGNCEKCTDDPNASSSTMTYKPSNTKFKVQGGVSSSTRLERLKLDTIMGSRINKLNCDGDCSDNLEHGSRRSYMGGKPRFVTLGSHTAGFVPTRWRQGYLAHGRAIGNIFQRTSSNDTAGHDARTSLPYSVGSIKSCGIDCGGSTN